MEINQQSPFTNLNYEAAKEFAIRKIPSDNCPCSESKMRFIFTVFFILLGIIFFGFYSYYFGIRYVQRWIDQKKLLKTMAKNLSTDTAVKLSEKEDENKWFDHLEEIRPGEGEKGFVFLLDDKGKVLAHGKGKHLSRVLINSNYMFRSFDGIDDPSSHDTPFADMVRKCKKGGGYCHFYWKGDRFMVSYIAPVPQTNLMLGVAIPIPRGQKIWEENKWKSDTNKSPNRL